MNFMGFLTLYLVFCRFLINVLEKSTLFVFNNSTKIYFKRIIIFIYLKLILALRLIVNNLITVG